MSIVILSLGTEQGTATSAHLRHGKYCFEALVHGKRAALAEFVGRECATEMSFERLASWKDLLDFDDDQSCIKPSAEFADAVTLRGRVHGVIAVDEHARIVDLYLRAGPEFLAVSSHELGGAVPAMGSGLEVTVQGLCFYLTGT